MIAIVGGTFPRATKNQINRVGHGQIRSRAAEKVDTSSTVSAIAGFADRAVSTVLNPDACIGHSTGGGAAPIGALSSGILK
jgi:hypothetical protein